VNFRARFPDSLC